MAHKLLLDMNKDLTEAIATLGGKLPKTNGPLTKKILDLFKEKGFALHQILIDFEDELLPLLKKLKLDQTSKVSKQSKADRKELQALK